MISKIFRIKTHEDLELQLSDIYSNTELALICISRLEKKLLKIEEKMDKKIKKIIKKEKGLEKSTKSLLKEDQKHDKKLDKCDMMMAKKKKG